MTSISAEAGAAFPAAVNPSRHAGRTAALVACCLLAAAAVIAVARPDARILADAELARLLRGMALIKAVIVMPVLALLVWRFRSPIAPRLAIGYALAACAMSAAAALIWQLSAIAPAALLFHLGALTLMLIAWRDEMPRTRLASLVGRRGGAPMPRRPPA